MAGANIKPHFFTDNGSTNIMIVTFSFSKTSDTDYNVQ